MNEETKPFWRLALGALLLTAAMTLTAAPAFAQSGTAMVVPVGRAVGIKLFSDGVVVVGTSEVTTDRGEVNPARACGLKEGDIITHINATEVDTIEEVTAALQETEGELMSIRAIRGDRQIQLNGRAVQCAADGSYKLGAWIRDSMAGIGTVTFYCPETGAFGALGHGINDTDTALLMPLESGSILPATVAAVQKGEAGRPGQLRGVFDTSTTLGLLDSNTNGGVFGTLTDRAWAAGTPVETAERNQVKAGNATILANIDGDEVREYAIRIEKVYPESASDCRDFLIEVTDGKLLDTAGGIVQGMSGSPILQNGRLIGAVTHVMIDDPSHGYGVFVGRMLEQCGVN